MTKRGKLRRFLALLLFVSIILSPISQSVYAANSNETQEFINNSLSTSTDEKVTDIQSEEITANIHEEKEDSNTDIEIDNESDPSDESTDNETIDVTDENKDYEQEETVIESETESGNNSGVPSTPSDNDEKIDAIETEGTNKISDEDQTVSVESEESDKELGREESLDENTNIEEPEQNTEISDIDEYQTLSAEDKENGYIVEIRGKASDLNGAVSIDAHLVADERIDEYNKTFSNSETQNDYQAVAVYDISLLDENGNVVEPNGEVSVLFKGSEIQSLIETSNKDEETELLVLHNLDTVDITSENVENNVQNEEDVTIDEEIIAFSNEDEKTVIEDEENLDTSINLESLKVVEEVMAEGDTLSFTTDAFSEYVLVLTGNDTQKETQQSGNSWFEIDKYVEELDSEINNQSTYEVYLEQAYYTENTDLMESAPSKQYVYLVLDQSSTMSNHNNVENMNNAVEEFVTAVYEENAQRLEDARDGKYKDVNPDNDIMNQMESHLIYFAGILGFNDTTYTRYRNEQGFAPVTQEEAQTVIDAAHVEDDYASYTGLFSPVTTDIRVGTKTWLGLQTVQEWLQEDGFEEFANVILCTDGRPSMTNEPDEDPIAIANSGGMIVSATNMALEAAREMKDAGATLWGIYLEYDSEYTSTLTNAYSTGDISKLAIPDDACAIFMALYSSDYQQNGLFQKTNGVFTNYSYTSTDDDYFGKHTYLSLTADQFAANFASLGNSIISQDKNAKSGYVGSSSYINDEVSDPFEITDSNSVTVYKVPRIPASLDENNVPTDIDANGYVNEFRWGELNTEIDGSYDTEWIDITDNVSAKVNGNTVQVTGFDYEANAVTDFDKDYYSAWDVTDKEVYHEGDYGYKLVVVFNINAKITFGGNHIETNNSDTSAFYPSVPSDASGLPDWENNTQYNPDGNPYIEKYPVPYVDLKVNYDIPYDNLIIYAPQTENVHDLVTDTANSIWYKANGYSDAKAVYDNAKSIYTNALSEFTSGEISFNNGEMSQEDYQELEDNYYEAYTEYSEARDNLALFANYTPDGTNNAFVDIKYELKDPDGATIGTMTVPHGTAYDEENPNLDWTFTQENVTKSGEYTLTAIITPVSTNRAPGGHVYTQLDSDAYKDQIGYSSTEYSATGSFSDGSQSALTVTENPTAHIFQLKITMQDTRLLPRQTLDFNQGNENLIQMENDHLVGYEWVCTDGVTESIEENEPGVTGLLTVGGGVVLTSQIPDQARIDGLVLNIGGTDTTGDQDGFYVPVSVRASRNTGDINKSASTDQATTQTNSLMTDSDNIYGDGVSSIIWEHLCDIITDYDCNENEFLEASNKYGTPDSGTNKGPIRFLIHVQDNPLPDIHKTTTTPTITRGDDIQWSIDLSNSNEELNSNHRASDFSMVDILPYNGDDRIDPNTNREGSDFSGALYYKNITIDLTNAQTTKEWLTDGRAMVYYTDSALVRSADESQLLGTAASNNITWHECAVSVNGNIATIAGIPETATAIKFTTRLLWNDRLSMDMTSNLRDTSVQQIDDRYHNEAMVLNGNGLKLSETVATTVDRLYLSGTVWEDTDNDGLIIGTEKRIENVIVTLYVPYEPKNGGTPDRIIEGIQLTRAYDTNGDKYAPVLTGADGNYTFDDISAGTYYVVADKIPEEYDMTIKQAGRGDSNSSALDSEAEEKILTDQDEELAKSAWIKAVRVSGSGVPNQNFGLKIILGTVTIGKTLDEIYYPTTMVDEDKEDYRVTFTFKLRNTATNAIYSETVYLNEDTIHEYRGEPQVWCEFTDLPIGTYELTEISNAQYEIYTVTSDSSNVSYNKNRQTITINIEPDENIFTVRIDNKLTQNPPGGDQNGVKNLVNMRIPVSLDVTYVGSDPISSATLTSYTFRESDFAPGRGGDIVVTYDDGSTISLSDGTLNFNQLTLSPASVTNDMNSGQDKYPVAVYYAEKGRTVSDAFRVTVDLKPIHKFKLTFDSNGSSFNDNANKNVVNFGYDENKKANYVTSGIYKDVSNGGLRGRGSGYTFAGWNTRYDGTGVAYDGFTALNAIGADSGISALTLYANWKTNVTFNANGGTLSGGTTDAERALAGKSSGSISYNVNQTMATGLVGQKDQYNFVLWNTRSDGTGTNLEDYGPVTGPVTFYAIYYQSEYYYTGNVQIFIAPVNGWYNMQLWGAKGGDDDTDHIWGNGNDGIGGNGAYVSGEIYLTAGTRLYVYVGQPGADNTTGTGAGWNGGGNPGSSGWSGSGGGATDIRTVGGSWDQNLNLRIAVAAGGGGAGVRSKDGGYGGALVGGNGDGYRERDKRGMGGTQTEAGKKGGFGYGGTASPDGGGGGGGWYGGGAGDNDTGAGGGSSYISGYSGCSTSSTGYVFRNAQMIAGNQTMPAPDGGYEIGHSGECRARIQLISIE